MGLLTRIMAGNKLHAKGLSGKHSDGRMLVSGGAGLQKPAREAEAARGRGVGSLCCSRGQGKRRNTHALGDWRAGTKEE